MTKARQIDKGLCMKDPFSSADDEFEQSYYIPLQQIPVVQAYEKVGQTYERSIHDRARLQRWLKQTYQEME
jgi:hypothetical protein